MSEEKFDPQKFDVERELDKIRGEVKKPNIFICGATGSGKSSLICDIFNYSPDKSPKTSAVAPETRGVHKYGSDDLGVILHDSEGYEIGSDRQKHYMEDIIGYIDDCNSSHSLNNMDTRIHETWYCVSAGNKKFFDVDASIINDLRRRKIPVCVVITKVDCVDRAELDELIGAVRSEIPDIDIFTYASISTPALKEKMINAGYIQQDELLHWAAENLDESLRNGLLASVNGALGDKHAHVLKTIIPTSALSAVGIVVLSSFVPVPFTDSAALMTLQSGMALMIMNSYNIAGIGEQVVGTVLGSTLISTLGKTLANTLAKALPGISQAVAVANSTVAASLTATIGLTVNEICYQYMKRCVNNSGDPVSNFNSFFTTEMFKETFKTIQGSSGDLIKQIADNALSKINDKHNGGKNNG